MDSVFVFDGNDVLVDRVVRADGVHGVGSLGMDYGVAAFVFK